MFGFFSRRRPLTRPRGRANVFVPRLQALEERHLPSGYSYDAATQILRVEGDSQANTVAITDNGTGGVNNVTLTGSLGTFSPDNVVKEVRVRTHGGADTVTYALLGNLVMSRILKVELGDGNDQFTANLSGDILAGTFLVDVKGGCGADTLRVHAHNDVDVAWGATLRTELRGESGADTIATSYRGELDGLLDLFSSGGDDADTVGSYVTLDAGSTGKVGEAGNASIVRGDDSNDNLTFSVVNSGTAWVFARLEGSGGNDTGWRTTNVTRDCVETDFVVPFATYTIPLTVVIR